MALPLERRLRSGFSGTVATDEPLAAHTTYRIGGPARYFLRVNDLHSLMLATEALREEGIPWVCIGAGSNLLVSDDGFDGAVIALGQGFSECVLGDDGRTFTVGASCRLSHVVRSACAQGLSGLEFAVGTPGSVGGALRMNAGSSREYLGSRVVSVTTLRPGYGLKRYLASDLSWGYRETSLPYDEIVLECQIACNPADVQAIRQKMDSAMNRRRKTQPLSLPSCGSVFRNPENDSVGRLVENVGLKGAWCGGAQISELHANFIVNRNHAQAVDVVTLIHAAQDAVFEKYQIELVPEVRFLGFAQ